MGGYFEWVLICLRTPGGLAIEANHLYVVTGASTRLVLFDTTPSNTVATGRCLVHLLSCTCKREVLTKSSILRPLEEQSG